MLRRKTFTTYSISPKIAHGLFLEKEVNGFTILSQIAIFQSCMSRNAKQANSLFYLL